MWETFSAQTKAGSHFGAFDVALPAKAPSPWTLYKTNPAFDRLVESIILLLVRPPE